MTLDPASFFWWTLAGCIAYALTSAARNWRRPLSALVARLATRVARAADMPERRASRRRASTRRVRNLCFPDAAMRKERLHGTR